MSSPIFPSIVYVAVVPDNVPVPVAVEPSRNVASTSGMEVAMRPETVAV